MVLNPPRVRPGPETDGFDPSVRSRALPFQGPKTNGFGPSRALPVAQPKLPRAQSFESWTRPDSICRILLIDRNQLLGDLLNINFQSKLTLGHSAEY